MASRPVPDAIAPGQESVWDYPRPPALVPSDELVTVVLGGAEICEPPPSGRALETPPPPTYYLPRHAFLEGALVPASGRSFCEWKGEASYLDVVGGTQVARRAGWYYPQPSPRYASLRGHVALYPGAMDYCLVDGERVEPQPGGFYGGWITSAGSGPFKGGPGSQGGGGGGGGARAGAAPAARAGEEDVDEPRPSGARTEDFVEAVLRLVEAVPAGSVT